MLRGLPSWALSGRKASGAWPRSWDKVSTVQINLLLRTRVRGHQLVVTVREINRFYMQYKIMSYSWITIFFLHDKVVVQQKLIKWWSQNFIPWAVIYGVVNTTMFLHEWVWGLVFIFLSLKHSMLSLFHNNKSTHELVKKNLK